MKKSISIITIILLLFIIASCSSTKVLTNQKKTFPITYNDKSPVFLFPINFEHIGFDSNTPDIGLSISDKIASKHGKSVISGQQLYNLVGSLSWELTEKFESQAKYGLWEMKGEAASTALALSNTMKHLNNKLAELKIMPANYSFKYIIALHSYGTTGKLPKTRIINSYGGIYDVYTNELISFIETNNIIAVDETSALNILPNVYNDIIDKLISGKAK